MNDLFPIRWLKQFLAWKLDSKLNPATLWVTMLGIGFDKVAPGTLGSLLTVAMWGFYYRRISQILNHSMGSLALYTAVFLAMIYWISYQALEIYRQKSTSDDPKEVVIDEYIGQIITLTIGYISYVFWIQRYRLAVRDVIALAHFNSLALMVLSFIFFRIFDIWKPSLVGYFDRNWHNSHGIILDDIMAGLFAGCSMFAFWSIFLLLFK